MEHHSIIAESKSGKILNAVSHIPNETSSDNSPQPFLTKAQLERIEKNKSKAQTLRKSKLIAHPYSKK